ncbi:DUF1707 domain-containing protein [Corynebacterium qintianiae]|uniref:DUF1707 domain-containing protein n=1 Tax=Corynebacterium qintianiae TaxID=2709392 RepID=A0A7T0KLS6_9CORY|nr:DUF1707 domain-containing protein [Corynebacterium qintianiae]
MSTPYGRFRLSDNERNDAMSALSNALGEGRLTMDEFDARCKRIAAAEFQGDLEPIFTDIPQTPVLRSAPGGEVQLFSAHEIIAARRDGQKTRAGLFWLGSLGSVAGTAIAASAFGGSGLAALFLLIIPTLFILLYVMKVGPESWYTPSLRQLERKRRQLVRVQQLEIEAANAHEEAQRRAARKQQMSQITDDALHVAQQTVKRFKGK